jgi:uridine kinase
MARRSDLPLVPLDEFYQDQDAPDLPRRFGIVDWDDPRSWDAAAALEALTALAHDGVAEIPEYSIPDSRRTGTTMLDAGDAPVIVAEGIFAAELIDPLQTAGLLADALVLDRPAPLVMGLRLGRDLREGRKDPATLIRRGWGLARDQRSDLSRWTSAGMRPVGMHEGLARLTALRDIALAETHHRAPTSPVTVLRIAAVCFLREGDDGIEMLAVRKRGTGSYMQVGGKLEPGEDALEAACREVLEELDVVLDPEQLDHLGEFEAVAANEPDHVVRASVYLALGDWLPKDVMVRAELADALWAPLDHLPRGTRFAPLMVEHIVPTLRERLNSPA